MSALAVSPTDHLLGIGLDELVEEAAMMSRIDRKYVVPMAAAYELLSMVPVGTRVLEIDGRREFGYRSAYLDTPDRHSFFTSGRGHRRRWKLRSRVYLDTGGCWLELKTAGPRGVTVKERIEHPDPEAHGLTAEGRAFAAPAIGAQRAAALSLVLATTYRRTTLLLPGSGSRATIDVGLGWGSLGNGRSVERPGLAIVETKAGSTPSEIDRLLWSLGHRPVKISKFGVGMSALHPELPRLKWHRAMDRHLSLPPHPITKDHA